MFRNECSVTRQNGRDDPYRAEGVVDNLLAAEPRPSVNVNPTIKRPHSGIVDRGDSAP